MRLTGTDDAATLDASIKLVNVPLSATAKTEVLGYGAGTGAQPVTLFSDISHADSAGTVSVSTGGLSKLKDYKRFVMRMSAASGNAVLYEGSAQSRSNSWHRQSRGLVGTRSGLKELTYRGSAEMRAS